jgi:uncharacterized protein with HEPN domain
MSPRDEVSLRQMLDHSLEALQLSAGRTRSDLDSDRLFNLAMTRLLEIIGEAAGRVSQSMRDIQPPGGLVANCRLTEPADSRV